MDGELWVRLFSKDLQTDIISIPLVLFDRDGVSSTMLNVVINETRKIVATNFYPLLKIWLKNGYKLLKYLWG